MKLTNENIEKIYKIYKSAMTDISTTTLFLEKMAFESYLDILFIKVVKIKTPEAEKQLQHIEWMKNWLERQTNINLINVIQSRMLLTYENQIVKLQFENQKLLEENQKLKENIK